MQNQIIQGDCLEVLRGLPDESVDMVMTSPPYWALRDYGVDWQIGLEQTFQEYISKLGDIFDEVRRVLKKQGTCWVNIWDTYWNSSQAGTKVFWNPEFNENRPSRELTKTPERNLKWFEKSLLQIPSRFAIEMSSRGWILRNELIWHKPNCMPSSSKDRFTVDFEKIFFFVKSKKYHFETQMEKATYTDARLGKGRIQYENRLTNCGVKVSDTRIKRAVWKITVKPFREAHFATYPEELCETPILAGCPVWGVILDPFFWAGTTWVVAKRLGRNYIGIELNPEYIKIAEKRIGGGYQLVL